jgi:hypothetical protein
MPLHKTPKFHTKLQAFAYENLSKKDLFELLRDAVLQISHINEDDCFIEVVMNGSLTLRTSDDDGISKKLAKAQNDASKY